MQAFTPKQQKIIVSNVVQACGDIEKLNFIGYKFLYLANGFIAHYDLQGFKAYYSEHSLKDELAIHAHANQWRNFSSKDKDYEYYMSKREIYNRILGALVAEEYEATYKANV